MRSNRLQILRKAIENHPTEHMTHKLEFSYGLHIILKKDLSCEPNTFSQSDIGKMFNAFLGSLQIGQSWELE